MIHFLPESPAETRPAPYAEAVARLASIRQALRLVEQFEGEERNPAIEVGDGDDRIAAAWPTAKEAARRCFAARSERTAGLPRRGSNAAFPAVQAPAPPSLSRAAGAAIPRRVTTASPATR